VRESAIKEFRRLPGVGEKLAGALWDLGVRSAGELKGQNPGVLYQNLCNLRGGRVDKCVLYVFRCAVYYASNDMHNPRLLKWWNWKD
jgi:hypothetical protein